jgi:hypothetical protein
MEDVVCGLSIDFLINRNSHLTLCSGFCCLCAMSVNVISLFSLHCHYMFQPNWPSSSVYVVMKESTAHCNSVLLFLCSCPRIIIGYVS